MRFGILGSLEAGDGERRIELARPKQRAVLAALLVRANRIVPLDTLIDFLWGGEPPATATGALQVHISGIRAALEPGRPAGMRNNYLMTRAPGYLLRVRPDDLDATRFENLAAEGQRLLAAGQPAAARGVLVEGLSLWRGPALDEFASEPFAQPTATMLQQLRLTALEDRIDADLALGAHVAVTAELELLVAERPLRERFWGQLMLALYRSERQSEALRTFTRARAALIEELGIEPGPALRRLEDEILDQAPSLDWHPPTGHDDGTGSRRTAPRHHPAAGTGPGLSTPPLGPLPPLVGRREELATLDRSLADALTGRGAVALVSGEPGVGKTRLVEELVSHAIDAGFTAAWGRCHDGDGAPSCWPWVHLIRNLLLNLDPDVLRDALAAGAAEIAQIAPEVERLVGYVEPPPIADPATTRFHLYEAVHGLVAALAARGPFAVVIEDIHWADVPSLQLIQFVAERIASTRVALIVTFRNVDPLVAGPLADTLGALASSPALYRVHLAGLGADECGVFIAENFGVTPSPAVAASVHARTEGNPFFVAELARLMASENELAADQPTNRSGVPAGVQDVVARRLGRLPSRTNELLMAAAVIGRDVDLRLLSPVAGINAEDALDHLDAAIAVGILVECRGVPGRFKFVHAVVHETILRSIGLAREAKLHARAATALTDVFGEDDDHAVRVAQHLYAGAPVVGVEQALAAALHAADVSSRRVAFEQAETQLRHALELIGHLPPSTDRSRRELEVQHRLATLLGNTLGFHASGVAAAWARAHELCVELGETPELLDTLWGLSRLSRTRAEFGVAMQLGQELLALAAQSPDRGFAVAGHESIGQPAIYVGDLAAADCHLGSAIGEADAALREPRCALAVAYAASACRGYRACVRWILGDDDGAERLSLEALRVADEFGDAHARALVRIYRAKLMTFRRDAEATVAICDECLRMADSEPLGSIGLTAQVIGSWAQAVSGGLAGAGGGGHVLSAPASALAAAAAMGSAMASLRATGWRLALSYFHALHADAYRAAGRLDLAMEAVETGLVAAAAGERYYEPELCRLAGELTRARMPHRPADADIWFLRAVASADRQGAVAWKERAEASLAGPVSVGR